MQFFKSSFPKAKELNIFLGISSDLLCRGVNEMNAFGDLSLIYAGASREE